MNLFEGHAAAFGGETVLNLKVVNQVYQVKVLSHCCLHISIYSVSEFHTALVFGQSVAVRRDFPVIPRSQPDARVSFIPSCGCV